MAFRNLMLTTYGMTLYAKAQQGKRLHLTRVAVGDGVLGSGESLVNRAALKSERASFPIDYVQIASSSSAAEIVTTMRNDGLAEGFYFRELGVCALDPDTGTEYVYLYDYAGEDGEYIPAASENVQVIERLKMLIRLENTPNVTFTPSGNPLYLSIDDIRDDSVGLDILWSSQKIQEQLEAAAGTGAAALRLDITIPAAGWAADTDTGGAYALHVDIAHGDITGGMVPDLALLPASLKTAVACGLSPAAQTFEGKLRLYAKRAPAEAMQGSLTLTEGSGGS